MTLNPTLPSLLTANAAPGERSPGVVIGAGLGGLTCAAYLARPGLPVAVLEHKRHNKNHVVKPISEIGQPLG